MRRAFKLRQYLGQFVLEIGQVPAPICRLIFFGLNMPPLPVFIADNDVINRDFFIHAGQAGGLGLNIVNLVIADQTDHPVQGNEPLIVISLIRFCALSTHEDQPIPYTLLYLVYRVPYNTTDTILQQPNFFDTLPTSL
ncbi:MAG: hypothetical protein D3912_14570 [Candidatus Electrothrix sp. AX1]|nr:hypothetical protein [Candidatus Electrothrix sp. AX1]